VNQRKQSSQKRVEGIDVRHSRSCASRGDSACNCKPTYQAHVWSKRESKRIRKTFSNLSEAKSWRRDALSSLERGTMRAPSRETLKQKADALIEGMRSGSVRDKSGRTYKPSTIRSYEKSLKNRVLPSLGEERFSELRRSDWQQFADKMLAEGLDASTIRNTLMPVRVIYRRALEDEQVIVNPLASLRLPRVEGKRDRFASPNEASALLSALAEEDRALWATAVYAGLRLGELQALRVDDVDLSTGLVKVERAWDKLAGIIATKNRKCRTVPIPAALREHLAAHFLRTGRRGQDYIFGGDRPFRYDSMYERAQKAWKAAGLQRIGLHECRHTFASLMIAAGVNAKALSSYMGHSSVTITYDRYGHLMPGNENEAAQMLDDYLAKAAVKEARS
jgi:integrase